MPVLPTGCRPSGAAGRSPRRSRGLQRSVRSFRHMQGNAGGSRTCKKKSARLLFSQALFLSPPGAACGGGGSRTLVQTGNPKAFYTLIRRLILLPAPGRRPPNAGPSPLNFARGSGPAAHYLPMDDTPYEEPLRSGTALRDTRRQSSLAPAIKPIFLEN